MLEATVGVVTAKFTPAYGQQVKALDFEDGASEPPDFHVAFALVQEFQARVEKERVEFQRLLDKDLGAVRPNECVVVGEDPPRDEPVATPTGEAAAGASETCESRTA
jgi:hypothetical protein